MFCVRAILYPNNVVDSCIKQLKHSIREWDRLQSEIRSPIASSNLYAKSLEALARFVMCTVFMCRCYLDETFVIFSQIQERMLSKHGQCHRRG